MSKNDNPIINQVFDVTNEETENTIEVQEYKNDTSSMLDLRVQSEPGEYRGMQASTTGG